MKVGDKAPNFQVDLVTGSEFDLYTTVKNGPVVLNFIMGTWCPFCSNHLQKIRQWQSSLKQNTTMIIISSENEERLRDWALKNQTSYLFATDPRLDVINLFNVKNKMINTATPTTLLIDSDQVIKMIFGGIRTDKSREKMKQNICQLVK